MLQVGEMSKMPAPALIYPRITRHLHTLFYIARFYFESAFIFFFPPLITTATEAAISSAGERGKGGWKNKLKRGFLHSKKPTGAARCKAAPEGMLLPKASE